MSSEVPQKTKYVRKKCEHGKQSYYCIPCGGKGVCPHGKIKSGCKECGTGSALCIHGKYKQHCREDGCGASICEHGHRRARCADCKGGSICEHSKMRSRCVDCNGLEICEHKIRKERCFVCKGSAICEHGIRKCRCIECNGSEICEHKNNKYSCVECHGKHICGHNKLRNQCIECDGTKICEHGKRKHICVDCKGTYLCIHEKQRPDCIICSPENVCQHCKSICVYKSKYKPYCFRCFCVLYPDAPIQRKFKLKEHYVRDEIKAYFGDRFTIIFDKSIEGGCSQKRPDILIDFGTHILIIEIDEHRHVNYTCEQSRMVALYEDTGFRNVVFLRFNPDGYTETNKLYPSPFGYTPTGMVQINKQEMDRRMKMLIESIEKCQEAIPESPIVIHYLFYGDPPNAEEGFKPLYP
jgi:hypothetical protein